MSQVQVGPPNLKEVAPSALAVANFLRHQSILKQRQGILNAKRYDFFRVKRAIRALESPAYSKAQKKNKNLPVISNRNEALETFRLLPLNRLAFRVEKLETQVALKNGLKPSPGVPILQIMQQQEFGDDMYYVWFHEPVRLITYLYAVLALAVIFAVVLFPLWPVKMRIGVWYLSMGALGLLGVFFGIAIIRLILFVITYFILSPGLWLFPNLFEDVGFFESFVPLWAWHGQKVEAKSIQDAAKAKRRKQLKKKKKEEKLQLEQEQQKEQSLKQQEQLKKLQQQQGGRPGGPGSFPFQLAGPDGQPINPNNLDPAAKALFAAQMKEIAARMERRKAEYIASGQPLPQNPQQAQMFTQRMFQEELVKMKEEFIGKAQQVQAQKSQAQVEAKSEGTSSSSSQPIQRIVTLEEDDE